MAFKPFQRERKKESFCKWAPSSDTKIMSYECEGRGQGENCTSWGAPRTTNKFQTLHGSLGCLLPWSLRRNHPISILNPNHSQNTENKWCCGFLPQLIHLQQSSCTQRLRDYCRRGSEILWEPEEQEVYCEIVSLRNVQEAIPIKPQ